MFRQVSTRMLSSLARPRLPPQRNEPFLHYSPGSSEAASLKAALAKTKEEVVDIPVVIGGKAYFTDRVVEQCMPSDKSHVLARVHQATPALVKDAIRSSLTQRSRWSSLSFEDRAAVFLKAADLLSTTWRPTVLAATMLGQGKNVWQAEIDAAVETIDFWRFNANFAEEIYSHQPTQHSTGCWNRVEYRPLDGFVYAVAPFNFTAIGSNLSCAPAQMGNVVLWKPSNTAALANFRVFELLQEAGLPPGVIQFVPAEPAVAETALDSPDFAGLHFTGSTRTFKTLWRKIGQNLDVYRNFPRVVGETGGKNFHFVHPSATVDQTVFHTVRSAFEYSGQKCSACSRAYVPESMWPEFEKKLRSVLATVKVGQSDDFSVFMSAVIDRSSFDKIRGFIEHVRADSANCSIVAGGGCSNEKGYFVEPTVVRSLNPKSRTMVEEIFGPVLTVYVYPDAEYEETLRLAADTSPYALTGSIFATDRYAVETAHALLRDAAGNFYVNDKSTGAVVGQQPFGGSRGSGTNDKAGFGQNLQRWVSTRTIKESFLPVGGIGYPSMKSA